MELLQGYLDNINNKSTEKEDGKIKTLMDINPKLFKNIEKEEMMKMPISMLLQVLYLIIVNRNLI